MLKLCFKSSIVATAVSLTVWDKMFYFSAVDGLSMQPLINKGLDPRNKSSKSQPKDFVFIQRPWTWNPMLLASKTPASIENTIQRGDVVSLISPKNVNECFIKRVVGLPGDIVKTIRYKEKYVLVPEGHCWIEGDNYAASYDSNSFGFIPMGLIIGKAKLIIFPWESLTHIKSKLPEHRCLKKIRLNRNSAIKCFDFVDLKNCQIKQKNSNLLLSIIGLDDDLANLENQIVEEVKENEELEIWSDDIDDDDDDDDTEDEEANETIE